MKRPETWLFLIAKALEAGGWNVLAQVVSPMVSEKQGLYCTYTATEQKVADDLLSVFQQKDLLIECEQRDDGSMNLGRAMDFPAIILAVGPKP